MSTWIQDSLHRTAEEVVQVDLLDRVLRQSRRASRRRALITAVAGFTVVALGTVALVTSANVPSPLLWKRTLCPTLVT